MAAPAQRGLRLVIANKNYSSWSLRPWLLMKQAQIPFQEEVVSLNAPDFKARVARYAPTDKVPVLVDDEDGVVVWDSLAIVEYLAERFRHLQLWPVDPQARALARSICAEMHAGFQDLRSQMPMNITGRFPRLGWNVRVQRDVDRIVAIWALARDKHGLGGPFLFGRFSVADAYFAPVTRRFISHEVALPLPARQYVETIERLPAMQAWVDAARQENDFVARDEPYRAPPEGR
jgi:glutathione S-transferase